MPCPADTAVRQPQAVQLLTRCHPLVWNGTGQVTAADYLAKAYDCDELPEPPASADHMTYRVEDLSAVREKVLQLALQALPTGRTRDLPLAVSEVAANGIRYGGGEGTLALWPQDGALPCELRRRHHRSPDRTRPAPVNGG